MDLFRIGAATQKRGKVNINTLQPKVLEALLKDATPLEAAVAAQAVLAKRNAGVTFTNVGQVFGAVSGILGTDPAQDNVAEAAIEKLAELITVRQNYFTVLVCAQAVKDVAGIRYDSNRDGTPDTDAAYGTFDAVTDASGNVLRYVDKILAEHRILAVVYRDAFSNRFRVEWTERLSE